jgi:hypothetical protein
MKIIDIGICVNNIDPKGIGRIRCIRYNDYVGEKEKSVKNYEEWDDYDPFVALPFLPNNINFIPEIGQSVKILNYNTDKETVNQEYIAGPFTTMYDYNSQNFTQQVENTTYGVPIKHKPNIRNTNGGYDDRVLNAFAKETDQAFYGKYGSDILFTNNGLQLRGGKLKSKENLSDLVNLIDYPLMAKKSANLYLKKFPNKARLENRKISKVKQITGNLNFIVEYEITSLTGLTDIKFYVYRVLNPNAIKFKTDFFNQTTPITQSEIKLINEDNSNTTPTYTITGISIDNAHLEIRNTIFTIHDKSLNELSTIYSNEDLHPFFFRPSQNFITLTPTNETESSNKNSILNTVYVSIVGPSSGLIWSKDRMTPKQVFNEVNENVMTMENNNIEQTFGAIKSDKIFLLSTDTNEVDKTINFDVLDKYELTQEDYVSKIEPNTYSTVRGENLVKYLRALYIAFENHVHNINKPYVKSGYDPHQILEELHKTLENDILNKSIKIN